MSNPDVIVVGGGVSGLSVAWWLAQAGIAVEVWEQDARPGGKILTREADGYLTERAASMMLNFRPEVSQMLASTRLDAAKVMCPGTPQDQRYLVQDGRLVPFPLRLGELMLSPLWSVRGKLRLLLEPFVPRGGHPDETVSEFIIRRLGREALEKAMEPFIAGPLASDPDQANAHAVLPRLVALERRYGSLALGAGVHQILQRRGAPVREMFSFSGGMSSLVEALAATPGVRFRAGSTATQLEPTESGWRLVGSTPDGDYMVRARHLVLSAPAPAAAALVHPLDTELARLLRGIGYAPLMVVHLAFDRSAIRQPLDGLGFLVPRLERLQLTGCQWISSLFPCRAPRGKVLLACYVGGARAPETMDWDDDQCIEAAVAWLGPLMGIDAAPERVWIDRHERALPLYHGAYLCRLHAIARCLGSWPGLHLAANYWGGVSVRDRIVRGFALAQRIRTALAGSRLSSSLAPAFHPCPAPSVTRSSCQESL
ncbi:MAG: protoporphyrinogen oxidase [Betaproteobacteria bacterium RIFCSPLOWO2_12_FULL_62_58]|nr:MAG: protoporphyrinogen oxidase [Betaproteobacteria bacterium RIFCSPLOWO2_12_FULL_62_58]